MLTLTQHEIRRIRNWRTQILNDGKADHKSDSKLYIKLGIMLKDLRHEVYKKRRNEI